MLQSIVDSILKWEITQILLVQKVFEPVESYLELISHVTTARFMHTYFFPFFLIMGTGVKQYVNIMTAAIISHISVILLKWMLAGTRPYWFVNESDLFTNLTRPNIRQTYLTCETTAGNPSGHVMFTASILFFVIRTIFYQSPWFRRYLNKPFKYFLWNVYVGVLGFISISRMFFACHFFHQCVLGSCFGIIISQFLQHRKVNRLLMEMHRGMALLFGIAVLSLCITVYYAHYILAHDPQWAVKKAFNWCKDPYYIKPETTPIYSLAREFGLMFGLILCSPQSKRFNIQMDVKWSLPSVFIITCLNKYILSQIPRWNGAIIFYSATFATNLAFIVVLLNIVPLIARKRKIKV
ncbi:glucose-6-phosphatase 2 [Contarinia nasturtii]|uniref:glucose-6-phosphatase 2 n=1 Tax=Contarinia nasturtii TaxID=265458 RepID=UPI0012D37651|nr:glucose-6-phosphatase 2 [Contarinia nasturtii]